MFPCKYLCMSMCVWYMYLFAMASVNSELYLIFRAVCVQWQVWHRNGYLNFFQWAWALLQYTYTCWFWHLSPSGTQLYIYMHTHTHTHTHVQLLMCGMDKVSYEDLKEHCLVNQGLHNARFHEVLSWFWTIVSSFTQEEMARLLQFVTGCSQLPPGGFKELDPRFTIVPAPTVGRLPTAHTW